MDKRTIVKIGGVLLGVLFFVLPLVQCSRDSNVNATGLEIATKSGELMDNVNTGYPVVFILLALPVILVITAFTKKPFTTLRNISIGGLIAQIAFMIAAYAMHNSGDLKGYFVLTHYNWLLIAIYAGLIVLVHSCIKQEEYKKNYGSHKRCRQCENIYSGSLVCPSCGSSLYEEVNNSPSVQSISPTVINPGDMWVCKKCGERNPNASSSCKSCGAYK
jgi:RNA polymerase subunit RPABC4/transcription elongation factor Spt4